MSTVLLESMLFGNPTMIVAFNDGKHSWSADKVSRMVHFKEVYDLPYLVTCKDLADFFPGFRALLAQAGNRDISDRLRENTIYFAYQDGRSYAHRVADAADEMVAMCPCPDVGGARAKPGKTYAMETAIGRIRNLDPIAAAKKYAGRLLK